LVGSFELASLVGSLKKMFLSYFGCLICIAFEDRTIEEKKEKKLLAPLYLYSFAVAHRYCSCAHAFTMGSSSASSNFVPVLRCPVLFDDTNYRD
jgi:hypothetical protein